MGQAVKITIEMDIPEGDDNDPEDSMLTEFRRQMEYITASVIDEGVGTMNLFDLRTEEQVGTSKLEDF
jgi:hypothetical protein